MLFSRQDKILYILGGTILILYRKLYIHIVSIIVLNIEARQYNIKINLAISYSPSDFWIGFLDWDFQISARIHVATRITISKPFRECFWHLHSNGVSKSNCTASRQILWICSTCKYVPRVLKVDRYRLFLQATLLRYNCIKSTQNGNFSIFVSKLRNSLCSYAELYFNFTNHTVLILNL